MPITPEQKARLADIAKRINESSDADFVKRLLEGKNRKYIRNMDGTISTHSLGYIDDGNGNAVVFPEVQDNGFGLSRYPFPWSYDRAVSRGDTIQMSVPDAKLFTENYKEVYPEFNKYDRGSRIARRRARRLERRGITGSQAEEGQEEPQEEVFFDGTLAPAVIKAPLPEKFHGSQAAARRYAEAQKFGRDIIQKRDREFEQYAPVVFGAPVAAGLGAAAIAPLAYTASTMAPVELAKALTEGASYLQPSKYIDWIARGFKPTSGMLSTLPYYSGAATAAGAIADTAVDAYFAADAARNAGKTGSVSGEIANATNFLPLIGPAAGLYNRVARNMPEYRSWARRVIGGDMSELEGLRNKAADLFAKDAKYENDADALVNHVGLLQVDVPAHLERETLPPVSSGNVTPLVNGTVSGTPFRYGDIDTSVPYITQDIGKSGDLSIEVERKKLGRDPFTGLPDDVIQFYPEPVMQKILPGDTSHNRWSRALQKFNDLPEIVSTKPLDDIRIRTTDSHPVGLRAFRTRGGTSLDILSPQTPGKSKPIQDYMDGLNTLLDTDGVVGGSTTLHASGYLSGTPHDTEIITTKSRLPEVEKKLEFQQSGGNDIAVSGTSKKGFNGGDMDIQVIQETDDGEATGRLAWSLYRTMHPADYQRQAEMSVLYEKNYTDRTITNPATGVPYTADELLDEFKAGGYSLQHTITDALSVMKDYKSKNIHKHNRPMSILTDTRDGAQEAVSEAISTIGVSQIGSGFRKGSEFFPNLRFDDVEENKKFLDMLGIQGEDIAENPEVMKNLFDYWYMQQSIQKRGVTGANKDLGKARRWTLESNFQRGGGNASGSGRNTVMATTSRMPFSYPYVGASQTHLFSPESAAGVSSISDVVTRADNLKTNAAVSDDRIAKAKQSFEKNYQNLMDSNPGIRDAVNEFFKRWLRPTGNTVDNIQDGLNFLTGKLQYNGIDANSIESVLDGLAQSFDLPFFRNMGSWYEGKYIGVLRKNSDAGGVRYFDFGLQPNPEVRPYEFGRDVEGYATGSISSPVKERLSPEEAAQYYRDGELEEVRELRDRMTGSDGKFTVGELQWLTPDATILDYREDYRGLLRDWLENTHEYEDVIDRLDRLESQPGVKAREKLNASLKEARQARFDRYAAQRDADFQKLADPSGISTTRRKALAKKYFDRASKEAGASHKFKDYNLVATNSDGSGFILRDKNTGKAYQVLKFGKTGGGTSLRRKSEFDVPVMTTPKTSDIKLRSVNKYIKEALQVNPGSVPGGFDIKNVVRAEQRSDGSIRLHYKNGGADILERFNGKWQFLDLPFSDGGLLLRDYRSGGKIHIDPSKKGTFTAAASKHGKSVQSFASQVLAHKENYSPALVKKANFARNAAKWHADGGPLNYSEVSMKDVAEDLISRFGSGEKALEVIKKLRGVI